MDNNDKSQFFSTREAIKKWLDKNYVKNYTINDDLSVDVNGNVNISDKKLKTIPVKFGNVTGSFYCNDNRLSSLAGSPNTVGCNFWCDDNKITSLFGSPKIVGGFFSAIDDKLISLKELINCNFKGKFYFNIDEKNFKQKELIPILEKYYISKCKRYELMNHQFHNIIKPVLEKEILDQKLKNSNFNKKINKNFI